MAAQLLLIWGCLQSILVIAYAATVFAHPESSQQFVFPLLVRSHSACEAFPLEPRTSRPWCQGEGGAPVLRSWLERSAGGLPADRRARRAESSRAMPRR